MKHGSVFTGIGGFDLAAEWMGWENVWNCEINERARRVLKKNFPSTKQYGDIKELINPEPVDVISGGFPCQDISYPKSWTTNDKFRENGIKGERSGLWWEYHRIINTRRPKFVVAENVAALQKQGLDIVIQSLSEIGYDAEWCIIDAARFGAPHLRKRIWIVAYPFGVGREQESVILGKILNKKIRQAPEWELSRTICKANGKKALPESYGIYDGVPRKLDDAARIMEMGNAVVPHIPFEIFKAISQYEHQT